MRATDPTERGAGECVTQPSCSILHLCESGETGGAETVLLRLVLGLNEVDFTSHIVLMKRGWLEGQFKTYGRAPEILESHRSYDISFMRRLIERIRRHHVDVIHSHLPDSNAYGCLAGALTRVPVIATCHGLIRTFGEPRRSDWAKLFLVRHLARSVVAVSGTMRDDLLTTGRFPAHKITVIYNGIDWSRYDQPFDRERLRQDLAIGAGDRLVGMVANLKPVKGYVYFVRAAARVLSEEPGVTFLILGQDEGGQQAQLVRLASELGIADRIRFLGFRDDVADILRSLDVFVLSSVSEGHPLSTIEAMGAGVPAIVSRIAGQEEIIQDRVTGHLVTPRNEAEFAERILEVLRDPGEAAALSERARLNARQKFGLDTMISRYVELYRTILGTRAGTRSADR